jgi:transcriptional regulator with XRE-family HTH domain
MRSELGQVILRLQAERGLSNNELAKRMNIQPQGVAKIKSRRSLHPRTLHRLAKALDVSVDIFLQVIR